MSLPLLICAADPVSEVWPPICMTLKALLQWCALQAPWDLAKAVSVLQPSTVTKRAPHTQVRAMLHHQGGDLAFNLDMCPAWHAAAATKDTWYAAA